MYLNWEFLKFQLRNPFRGNQSNPKLQPKFVLKLSPKYKPDLFSKLSIDLIKLGMICT